MKILIMGLPGSGKTTLAKILAPLLPAVHWNADLVRQNISKDLGFSLEDRLENARRLSWLSDQVSNAGLYCVTDFVCPIPETRKIFNADFVVFMNTISAGRFEDTNKLFVPPELYQCNYVVNTFDADTHAKAILSIIKD